MNTKTAGFCLIKSYSEKIFGNISVVTSALLKSFVIGAHGCVGLEPQ